MGAGTVWPFLHWVCSAAPSVTQRVETIPFQERHSGVSSIHSLGAVSHIWRGYSWWPQRAYSLGIDCPLWGQVLPFIPPILFLSPHFLPNQQCLRDDWPRKQPCMGPWIKQSTQGIQPNTLISLAPIYELHQVGVEGMARCCGKRRGTKEG